MARGWRRSDIGRRLSWSDFKDFVEWLPPTGESALWRSRKPKSWWITPEFRMLVSVLHVLSLANWQRGGGKKAGPAPKQLELPEDKAVTVKSGKELAAKRQSQAEHLRRRRAQRQKERR